MATYNFNGNPILAPFSIRSNEPVFYSETVSLKTQITSPGSQRWELSFKTLQQDNIVDEMVDSITTKVTGGTMVMPQVNAAGDRLAHQGTIEAQGAHAAGLQVIAVTGTNNSDTIPKGYFIKFAGHNKVYMVTSDADIDSGTGQLIYSLHSLRQSLIMKMYSQETAQYCHI